MSALTEARLASSRLKRSISERVKVQVWSRASGRCVLCAKYLIDERWKQIHHHSATLVGELAHNVGATTGKGSPRGGSKLSKMARHNEGNLVLLCHDCHRSIDTESIQGLFTVEWLTARKYEHEMRVRRATNFATLHKILVGTTRGPISWNRVCGVRPRVAVALIESGLVVHVGDGTRGDVIITLDRDLSAAHAWEHERRRIDLGLRKLTMAVETSTKHVDHIARRQSRLARHSRLMLDTRPPVIFGNGRQRRATSD